MIGKSGNRFSVKLMLKSDGFRRCAWRFCAVDLGEAIGDRTADNKFWVGGNDADCDGGATGGLDRISARGDGRAGSDDAVRAPDRASLDISDYGCVRTTPATAAARADLSAGPLGAGRHSSLQSRPERRARLHRDLCAGIPSERHRDHAAHELLLAPRLESSAR